MLVESNWEDKVEIVCISLDDAAENAQSRIEEQKWDRVSSYWAGS